MRRRRLRKHPQVESVQANQTDRCRSLGHSSPGMRWVPVFVGPVFVGPVFVGPVFVCVESSWFVADAARPRLKIGECHELQHNRWRY